MNRIFLLFVIAAIAVVAPLQAEETLPLKSVNKANEVIDAALAAHGGADVMSPVPKLSMTPGR